MSSYLPKLKKILILTPDSIGSTFFQRSITLYLNMHGIPTKNYHELANMGTSIENLVKTLTTNIYSTVARVSPYRSEEYKSHTGSYLKFCNIFFNDIYVINRCSFESALSYSYRSTIKSPLNVYSKKQYLENTISTPCTIPIDKFKSSLQYFEDFYVWVDNYFPIHTKVNYEDIVYNTDKLCADIFKLDTTSDLSITEYNKFNFLRVRDKDFSNFSQEKMLNYININENIQDLVASGLLGKQNSFPIKKVTLKEKTKNIKNFKELLHTYNNYPSNHFVKITEEQLETRIEKEQIFWTT